MSQRTSYAHPLAAIAAAVAWAAVGLELWTGPVVATAIGASLPVHGLARALHLAFGLVFAIPLALRARRTARLALAALLCTLALVLVALYRYNSAAALLVIPMLEFAALLGLPALAGAWLATNALLLAVVVAFRQMDFPLTYVGLQAGIQLFAIALVRSARRTEQARDELAATHAELLATRGMLAEIARGQERLRLSRELHDVAGHKLTALRLNLAALAHNKRLDTDEVVALCTRLTEELLDDLRSVAHQLRLHDGLDLGATMRRMAAPFPRPRVHLQIAADARAATLEQAEVLLRAFQEGLTNAARHGDAGELRAELRREGSEIVLDLRDDGGGGGDTRPGGGLAGMRERLHALGGELRFGHQGDGFRLQARLPA
ncbi:sensor histidine kinase [Dokdonella ginsengisoli]|uniref:Sensor histidine kinase n=1 Tax=Dokdonella ginsengisoli TaxID=363846 RepID=A0ABV9QWB0_9GAMM